MRPSTRFSDSIGLLGSYLVLSGPIWLYLHLFIPISIDSSLSGFPRVVYTSLGSRSLGLVASFSVYLGPIPAHLGQSGLILVSAGPPVPAGPIWMYLARCGLVWAKLGLSEVV